MLSFLKSKTMWAAFIVALLPYADVITGVTTGISPLMGGVISITFAVLRAVTTQPLSEK